jgi:hypothetical protein
MLVGSSCYRAGPHSSTAAFRGQSALAEEVAETADPAGKGAGYHPGGASGVQTMASSASPRSRLTCLNTSHSHGSTSNSMIG